VDEAGPTLRWHSPRCDARLLSLGGLARQGRFESGAFGASALVGFERRRARVTATYAPDGWGGLLVRARWTALPRREAIDLEIQVSASSVGELSALELEIASQFADAASRFSCAFASRVEARDARSAALSYDGRESAGALQVLTTLPLPGSPCRELRPLVIAPPGATAGVFYVEIAHPDDVARRIIGLPIHPESTNPTAWSARSCLFGHDLEKGVVLRARMRGCWIRSTSPEVDALALYQEFLREPLPLGP
jgi:hypothetical protein